MKIIKHSANAYFWTRIVIFGLVFGMGSVMALENGIGRTPAMGWNPWNAFRMNVSLKLLKEVIDSMVSNGMRDAGYTYMCCDGGNIMKGPESELQDFVNYGHSKEFKIGFYVGNGRGNEAALVTKWAQMGFDYLKHDDFNTGCTDPTWVSMRNALKTCGRQVYYTVHSNDALPKLEKPDTLCNAARVDNDILWKADSLNWGPTSNNGYGVMGEVMASRKYQNLAHPGYFNDMDMMGVGIPRFLTTEEARTHFSLWCIMAALLIEGSDVRHIAKDRLDILLNREVIAVNQDSLGEQGRVVWSRYAPADSTEVISKRMKDSSRAVLLFNRYGPTKSITVRMSDIGLTGKVHVRDLWKHVNLTDATDSVTVAGIAQHGCAMLRIGTNLISSVFYNPSSIAEQKKIAAHTPNVTLFNTRISSRLRLSPKHSGLQVFNLQGALLWEMHQPSQNEESITRLPAALKKVGMVVVKFIK